MSESNKINDYTSMEPIEKQFKSLRIGHNIKSMEMQGQIIFDSGASTCATSGPTLLRHIIYFHRVSKQLQLLVPP